MQRVAHGGHFPFELKEDSDAGSHSTQSMPFNYLFGNLQNQPKSLLPEDPSTVDALIELGKTMRAPKNDLPFSSIPSGYTYFGQLVDHDISFTQARKPSADPPSCDFTRPGFGVLPLKDALNHAVNARKSMLQLDVLYNCPALRDGARMRLGEVTITVPAGAEPPIPRKDNHHDVPRVASSADSTPLIGDPRNDNNLIVSQMQVAFLRAHNAFVGQGHTFDEAQTLLRQHYHWILIDDFLKRVADPTIVADTLTRADPLYDPQVNQFLPLEFTVAAYRFGHSLVRLSYYFNNVLPGISFSGLVTVKQLRNDDVPTPTLPDKRIIQWERFAEGGKMLGLNCASRIHTQMVTPLFKVLDEKGNEMKCEANLAVMDLLRGYMMRMPTGQAVAAELVARRRKVPIMSPAEIETAAIGPQKKALQSACFANGTPLWFYILAEAATLGKGNQLGPVGSTLVAEVLIGLVRNSPNSILPPPGAAPAWSPMKTATGQFKLQDLLLFAGVFDPNAT